MNKKKRAKLQGAIDLINQALPILEEVEDEESESLANMPENLESSERYVTMEEAVDHINDAIDSLNEAIGNISDAAESIDKAMG